MGKLRDGATLPFPVELPSDVGAMPIAASV